MGYGTPYIKNNRETNQKIGYIICESSINEELSEIKPKLIMDDRYNGRVVGEGVLQRANKKNRNGRFYDKEDLFPQLVCPRSKEMLKSGWDLKMVTLWLRILLDSKQLILITL